MGASHSPQVTALGSRGGGLRAVAVWLREQHFWVEMGVEGGWRASALLSSLGGWARAGSGIFPDWGPSWSPRPCSPPPDSCSWAQPRAGSWGFPGRAPRDNDSQLEVSVHRTYFYPPTAPRKFPRARWVQIPAPCKALGVQRYSYGQLPVSSGQCPPGPPFHL